MNIANLEVSLGELVALVAAAVLLVHNLCDSDHLAVVIAHGHAHQRAGGRMNQ